MKDLRRRHIALVKSVSLDFQRDFITKLPWNERLIAIKGSRGIGKTYLILQYIMQTYQLDEKALYISLDDSYFYNRRILDLADEFVSLGGKHLFIDEVHKYPNWATEIKLIYDYYPNLRVVFTGSSLLEILNSKADLSRRALSYTMQGFSFREFLKFKYDLSFEKYELIEILTNHTAIALEIGHTVKPLKYFSEYLETGYFPFAQEEKTLYYKRLTEVVSMILEMELPSLRKVESAKIPKVKQLLSIISESVPFKPNISSLATKINIARNSLIEYINALVDANILMSLNKSSFGVSLLQKPEKLFLENTNFMYAISSSEPNVGSLRETFFLNQLTDSHKVTYPEKGDFLVDEKYTFEVGGKNKSDDQIKGIPNAYLAVDNIEFSSGNTIPLWLFGFLY
jgi:predicted AAA+ superfamily ATPase